MTVETPLNRLPMTKKLRAVLTDALTSDTLQFPWEIGSIPRRPNPDNPQQNIPVLPPYGILYPLWPSYDGPPFGASHADATWTYQASAYLQRGDQAEWARDKIVRVAVGLDINGEFLHPLDVDGMYVMLRELTDDAGLTMPDQATGLHPVDVRFAITVTPQESP